MDEVKVSYGVENVVNLVKFGGAIAAAIKAAKADGKLDAADLGLLFPVVPMFGPVLSGIGKIPKELGDLSQAELDAVVAEVSKIEGIGDRANVLVKIKAGINFGYAGFKLYEAFAK